MEAKKSKRLKADAYLTPERLARAIVRNYEQRGETPKLIIEPSAGRGSFVKALRRYYPNTEIVAVELRPECKGVLKGLGADRVLIGDWLHLYKKFVGEKGVLVIGNPPYSAARSHTEAALAIGRTTVLFLLRMAFLHSKKRQDFWQETHPFFGVLQAVVPRPSFLKTGSDNSEYGMFQWVPRRTQCVVLPALTWSNKRKRS